MTKKKFFASLGVMTALVGVSVFGAMMCMGNAASFQAPNYRDDTIKPVLMCSCGNGALEKTRVEPTTYRDGYVSHYCDSCLYYSKTVLPMLGSVEDEIDRLVSANTLKSESVSASAAVSPASSDVYDYVIWNRGSLKSMIYNGGTYYLFSTCPICGGHESTDVTPDSDTGIVGVKSAGAFETPCSYGIMHNVDGESKCMELFCLLHDGEEVVLTEPTCTTAGTSVIRCKDCGEQGEMMSIPASGGHTFDRGVSVAADDEFCADVKYTCTGCGATYYGEDQIRTQRVRHEYELIDETPADCLNGGTRIKECKTCGHRVTEEIPKGEHSIPSDGIVTIEPTCTKTGLEEFYCMVCNKKVDERIVAALGHKWKTVPAVEATCTDDGMSEYTVCENCGEYFAGREPVVDEAEGHQWVTVEEDRDSCDVEGERRKVCEVCGEEEVETIPAGTHTWDEGTVTKAPTCLESGIRERTCVYCGAKDQETLSATGHISVNLAAVEATCTESGLTAGSKCSACGTILNAQQIVPAKGHTLKHVNAVEPSETASGNIEYWHCANCGGYFTDKQGANQVSAEDVLLSPGEQTGMAWWQIALAVVAGVILIAGIGVVIDNFIINKDDNAFLKNKAKKEKK